MSKIQYSRHTLSSTITKPVGVAYNNEGSCLIVWAQTFSKAKSIIVDEVYDVHIHVSKVGDNSIQGSIINWFLSQNLDIPVHFRSFEYSYTFVVPSQDYDYAMIQCQQLNLQNFLIVTT